MADESYRQREIEGDGAYAQISSATVKIIAETVGISELSDNISSRLAEDATYRIREAAMNSCQYMRHGKRRKLVGDDFNRALNDSDVEPVFGYDSSELSKFTRIADTECFFQNSTDVCLSELALQPLSVEQPLSPTVRAQWLAVEGIQCTSNKKPISNPPLSEQLLRYYEHVTSAILSSDPQLNEVALTDLKSNANIAPVLPYLINFIYSGVKTLSYDLLQMKKLLDTAHSLVHNESLYFGPKPYLSVLLQAVRYCILEPLSVSTGSSTNQWNLRDYAAMLLVEITRLWATPVNRLQQHAYRTLLEAFTDDMRALPSHYGALMGLASFGPEVVEEVVGVHLHTFVDYLSNKLVDKNRVVASDAWKVHGLLLLTAEKMIRRHVHLVESDANADPLHCIQLANVEKNNAADSDIHDCASVEKHPHVKINELYNVFSEYFGESLYARLPQARIKNPYKKPEKKTVNKEKEGMELLQEIIQQVEEERSMSHGSVGESKSSYDDDDINAMDLRVKETFSDPAIGIKVTISRRPKQHLNTDQTSNRVAQGLYMRPPYYGFYQQDLPFDYAIPQPRQEFIFCYTGAMVAPVYALKRRRVSDMHNQFKFSIFHQFSVHSGKIAKHKIKHSAETLGRMYRRKFITGNLDVTL